MGAHLALRLAASLNKGPAAMMSMSGYRLVVFVCLLASRENCKLSKQNGLFSSAGKCLSHVSVSNHDADDDDDDDDNNDDNKHRVSELSISI